MKVLVFGCVHGNFDEVYDTICATQPDISILNGDLQAFLSDRDLSSGFLKDKYENVGSFIKFFTGERLMPCLCICIGGNHENNAFMPLFPYGGFIARNIFYLGYCGVVNVVINGELIVISGVSGLSKMHTRQDINQFLDRSLRRSLFIDNSWLRKDDVFGFVHTSPHDLALVHLFLRTLNEYLSQDHMSDKSLSNQPNVVRLLFLTHEWPCGVKRFIPDRMLKSFLRQEPHDRVGGLYLGYLWRSLAEVLISHEASFKPVWLAAHMHNNVDISIPLPSENIAILDAEGFVGSFMDTLGVTPLKYKADFTRHLRFVALSKTCTQFSHKLMDVQGTRIATPDNVVDGIYINPLFKESVQKCVGAECTAPSPRVLFDANLHVSTDIYSSSLESPMQTIDGSEYLVFKSANVVLNLLGVSRDSLKITE